ncbi:MAG: PadR family transcriptional regulator [Enterococcus sp.]
MIPLLILGLIKETPGTHGYEMLLRMKERNYKYVVNYTKGSFYYNLQQLEEKKYIQRIDSEFDMKEKKCYQLTQAGEEEFHRLMVQTGSKTDYVNLSFYAALLFEKEYDAKEMKKLIQIQINQTKIKMDLLKQTLATRETLQENFAKMLENSYAHHQVNLQWYTDLLESLE